ncbi:MAG: ribosome recycling factor [Kiritimatiellia bacterium]
MESVDDVLLDADDKMSKSVEFLKNEFAGLRSGKASPALVENVRVQYYGATVRLKEIAQISTPEPRLIVVNAYDPTSLPNIEKAILAANLGVTPINDGRIIRIPIPELSQERRVELTKVARRLAEEARVAIRNVRREANEAVRALHKEGKLSEDARDKALDEIQKETDTAIAHVDELLKAKEKEIMEV